MFSIAAISVIMIILIPAGIALASQTDWYGTVGGVNAHAQKNVWLDSYLWQTDLYSGASQNINVIGYSYWTVGEYCPSLKAWSSWEQFSGDYSTIDSSYYTAATMYYEGCSSGLSRYWSLGNHDFAYGTQHLYPYVSTYEQN